MRNSNNFFNAFLICLLVLSCSKEDKDADTNQYVHRGIARRSFSKSWTLSDDMIVNGAEFQNGLLNINLEKVVPEEKKPRIVPITVPNVIEHKKK